MRRVQPVCVQCEPGVRVFMERHGHWQLLRALGKLKEFNSYCPHLFLTRKSQVYRSTQDCSNICDH